MLKLTVDSPVVNGTSIELRDVYTPVNGWILHPKLPDVSLTCEPFNRLQFLIFQSGQKYACKFSLYKRSDLDPAYGTGFTVYLSIARLNEFSESQLQLVDLNGPEIVWSINLSIEAVALNAARALADRSSSKSSLVRSLLKENALSQEEVWQGCPVNYLPSSWPLSPSIEKKRDPVSSHPYDSKILEFVNSFPHNAAIIDVGAGLRRTPHPGVICCEIYDYPSTDVLCLASALPFRDGSIDAILCFAVLEHVPNPFDCAREFARVLKKGGIAYIIYPFLQAEHGYPNHYFNATRSGVLELFKDFDCISHYMAFADHPILTLEQILGIYSNSLGDCRDKFNELTVREVLNLASRYRQQNLSVRDSKLIEIDQAESWKIAWGSNAIFRKP